MLLWLPGVWANAVSSDVKRSVSTTRNSSSGLVTASCRKVSGSLWMAHLVRSLPAKSRRSTLTSIALTRPSWHGQTSSEPSRCAPTPTRRMMQRPPVAWARKELGCVGLSTCSLEKIAQKSGAR